MKSAIQGKCNCGEVVFEVLGPLPDMYKCFCTLCQKQSGAASNAATIVKEDSLQWIHGVSSVTVWKKDSGFNSQFCSTCGCPVPNPIGCGYYWVPMGLLPAVDSTIVVNLFTDARPAWDLPKQTEHLIEGVDNVDELFEALASGGATYPDATDGQR